MKSKILDLGLDFAGAPRAVIKEHWETIEHHRNKGITLNQIYIALSKKEGFEGRICFVAFKSCYYRQRKLKHSGEAKRDPVAISKVAETVPLPEIPIKSDKDSKPSGEIQSPALSVSSNQTTPSLDAVEKANPEHKAKKTVGKFKRLELGGTIEEQQAIAAQYFNQD